MAASSGFSIFVVFCFIVSVIISIEASGDHRSDWIPIRSGCRGTIADCLSTGEEPEEFELDSESNRRILATSRYVSYGALQRDNVPCSRRGASYYNCRKSGQANPYTRGCSAITRCRS